MNTYIPPIRPDELYHHGIKGMHWGVRRYQNPDGTLTAAGKRKYYKENAYQYHEDAKSAMNEYVRTKKGREHIHDMQRASNAYVNADRNAAEVMSKAGDVFTAKEAKKIARFDNAQNKAWNEFQKASNNFDRGAYEYMTNKMIKKYGETNFKILNDEGYYGNWKYDVPKQKRR